MASFVASVGQLIQAVEGAGGRFEVDGATLGVLLPGKVRSLREQLRQRKWDIIAALEQRPRIPAGVHLVRYEPKIAPVQLSRAETITDTSRFIGATLRQMEARLQGAYWLAGNWTLSTLIDRLAAAGCVVELENPRQAIQ